jgi:hypothetical protein
LGAARQLAAYLAANELPVAVADVRRRNVEAYIAHLLDRFKPGTAVTRYQDLRVFFGWLVDEEEIPASPMALLKPSLLPEVPVPVLTVEEQRALLSGCEGKAFDARWDYAIICCSSTPECGGPSWRTYRSATSTSTSPSRSSSARAGDRGPARSAHEPPRLSTATYASASVIASLTCRRCSSPASAP